MDLKHCLGRGCRGRVAIVALLVIALHIHSLASCEKGYRYGEEQAQTPKDKERSQEYCGQNDSSVDPGYLFNGTAIFKAKAESGSPVTDKVHGHTYEIMYGTHLLPYYHQHPKMKMLEIGLGCDMRYGAGASVWLWKELFPEADLWEAEFNGKCVEEQKAKGKLDVRTLVGDQGDPNVLDQWILESGGDFDVIIDDGGHTQCQIWTTFEKLWPTIKPGGFYFIEDLQVAKERPYKASSPTCDGTNLNVPNKLKEVFMDKLIYSDPHSGEVEFLFCQPEACGLKKRP